MYTWLYCAAVQGFRAIEDLYCLEEEVGMSSHSLCSEQHIKYNKSAVIIKTLI